MAFARRRRFGGNKTATVKQPKVHTVDGITYKSKALAVLAEGGCACHFFPSAKRAGREGEQEPEVRS